MESKGVWQEDKGGGGGGKDEGVGQEDLIII